MKVVLLCTYSLLLTRVYSQSYIRRSVSPRGGEEAGWIDLYDVGRAAVRFLLCMNLVRLLFRSKCYDDVMGGGETDLLMSCSSGR